MMRQEEAVSLDRCRICHDNSCGYYQPSCTCECHAQAAQRQLEQMTDALAANAFSYFKMGEFKCRRELDNGAVVTMRIKMPALQSKRVRRPPQAKKEVEECSKTIAQRKT